EWKCKYCFMKLKCEVGIERNKEVEENNEKTN
ncbi:unnamed protein product, partial [marine sediment metagenome]